METIKLKAKLTMQGLEILDCDASTKTIWVKFSDCGIEKELTRPFSDFLESFEAEHGSAMYDLLNLTGHETDLESHGKFIEWVWNDGHVSEIDLKRFIFEECYSVMSMGEFSSLSLDEMKDYYHKVLEVTPLFNRPTWFINMDGFIKGCKIKMDLSSSTPIVSFAEQMKFLSITNFISLRLDEMKDYYLKKVSQSPVTWPLWFTKLHNSIIENSANLKNSRLENFANYMRNWQKQDTKIETLIAAKAA